MAQIDSGIEGGTGEYLIFWPPEIAAERAKQTICSALSAAISGGQKIRHSSPKMKVQLEVV
jgi:hypothetical protein